MAWGTQKAQELKKRSRESKDGAKKHRKGYFGPPCMLKIDAKMIPKSQNHHFCYTIGKLTLRMEVFFWKLVWIHYLNMQKFSALVVWKKIFFVCSGDWTLDHLNEKFLNFFWLGIWNFLHFWNIEKLSNNFWSATFGKFGLFHSAVVKGLRFK